MRWVTHLGGARATIGIPVALVAAGATRLGLAALAANAFSHALVQVLKRAVARPRPCGPDGRLLALVDLPDPFSFPSGHAAAAAALATSVVLARPETAPLLLPLAAAVGYSRVALRLHHPGDVLAGALLGAGSAIAAALFV